MLSDKIIINQTMVYTFLKIWILKQWILPVSPTMMLSLVDVIPDILEEFGIVINLSSSVKESQENSNRPKWKRLCSWEKYKHHTTTTFKWYSGLCSIERGWWSQGTFVHLFQQKLWQTLYDQWKFTCCTSVDCYFPVTLFIWYLIRKYLRSIPIYTIDWTQGRIIYLAIVTYNAMQPLLICTWYCNICLHIIWGYMELIK
jgi:hypothetical protein